MLQRIKNIFKKKQINRLFIKLTDNHYSVNVYGTNKELVYMLVDLYEKQPELFEVIDASCNIYNKYLKLK